jgi:acyl-CoA thioester hydrolase
MRLYRLERRVSHADVDFLGELKVSALLGLLEQAAVEASIDAGFDAARYMRERRIWIIHRTRLQRLFPVGGGDRIDVDTAVCDFRRVRSLRRYWLRMGTREVAHASTDWVYCDLATGRPARVPEVLQQALLPEGGVATALPRAPALRAEPPPEAVHFTLTVQPSHLDHVSHVNNAIYANFLEDGAFALFAARGWPLPRMLSAGGALRTEWLDIEHRSDAQAGEELIVRSWLPDGSRLGTEGHPRAVKLLQLISRADASEVVCAASDWVWRQTPAVIGGPPRAGDESADTSRT